MMNALQLPGLFEELRRRAQRQRTDAAASARSHLDAAPALELARVYEQAATVAAQGSLDLGDPQP